MGLSLAVDVETSEPVTGWVMAPLPNVKGDLVIWCACSLPSLPVHEVVLVEQQCFESRPVNKQSKHNLMAACSKKATAHNQDGDRRTLHGNL